MARLRAARGDALSGTGDRQTRTRTGCAKGWPQFAEGQCARFTNEQVANGLAAETGWILLSTLITTFRTQPDLRPIARRRAWRGYLYRVHGVAGLRANGGPPREIPEGAAALD
jgi:hypothetical protein